MTDWQAIRHFSPDEFDSPDMKGSGIQMDVGFVKKLDELRDRCGFPFKIRSGFRTAAHNRLVGGVDSSSHEAGLAVDIQAETSSARCTIVREAFDMGFRRMGIGQTFVHIDADTAKPQDVLWLYPNK